MKSDEFICWIDFAIREELNEKDEAEVLKEAREFTAIFIASRKSALREIK